MIQLRVGYKYPITPPPVEGFVARINGASFDCIGFAKNLRKHEIKQFRRNPLRYGIYETHLTAFFLIEIAKSDWYFDTSLNDTSLNFAAEKPEIQDGFLNNEGNLINLILCDYTSGTIKVLRAIGIRHDVMQRIKNKCRDQLASTAKEVDNAITNTYRTIGLDEMIRDTDMYRL